MARVQDNILIPDSALFWLCAFYIQKLLTLMGSGAHKHICPKHALNSFFFLWPWANGIQFRLPDRSSNGLQCRCLSWKQCRRPHQVTITTNLCKADSRHTIFKLKLISNSRETQVNTNDIWTWRANGHWYGHKQTMLWRMCFNPPKIEHKVQGYSSLCDGNSDQTVCYCFIELMVVNKHKNRSDK